jgi:hypothetical protein
MIMKKLIVSGVVIAVLVLAAIFGSNSCNSSHLVDFHKVVIPEYNDSDYVALLDNPNKDIVYNSVCNLIDIAPEYGELLSNDTIKDTLKFNLAKLAYTRISSIAKGSDEWAGCASIRFLAQFGQQYKKKDEIIKTLMDVKLTSKSAQLELVNAFQQLGCTDAPICDKRVAKLLRHSSWVVSRFSYNLVGLSQNPDLTNMMVTRYRYSTSEYEKLLILQSIGHEYGDSVFTLITSELEKTQTAKLQRFLAKLLGEAADKEKSIAWINTNFKLVNSSDIKIHYLDNMGSKVGAAYIITALADGYNPAADTADCCQPRLYKQLFDKMQPLKSKTALNPEEKETLNNLLKIEAAVTQCKDLAEQWDAFQKKSKGVSFPEALNQKHRQLTEEHMQKTYQLFEKHGVDKDRCKEYMKRMKELEDEFFK